MNKYQELLHELPLLKEQCSKTDDCDYECPYHDYEKINGRANIVCIFDELESSFKGYPKDWDIEKNEQIITKWSERT